MDVETDPRAVDLAKCFKHLRTSSNKHSNGFRKIGVENHTGLEEDPDKYCYRGYIETKKNETPRTRRIHDKSAKEAI